MKKVFCLLIVTLLLGCGGGGGGGSSTPTSSPSTPVTNDPPSTPTTNDPPSPPPSQPRIELVGSILTKEDLLGDLILFGEVKNTGNAVATFVQAKCDFYNAQSTLIGNDSTYIDGTVVRLTLTNMNTNTALKPSQTGVFKVWTTLKKNTVASYNCSYSFDVFGTADPSAKLEVIGTVNLQADGSNHAQFLGQVKNTGTKGLIFGEVIFVSRDANGLILDINSDDINGETVLLQSIGMNTDTALNVNGQGTFSVSTSVPFSDVKSYDIKYAWDDSDVQNGVAREINLVAEKGLSLDKKERFIKRNQAIEELRQSVNR